MGKNGSGKTNILHSIRTVCQLAVGAIDPTDVTAKDQDLPICFALTFSSQNGKFRYATEIVVGTRSQESQFSEKLWHIESQHETLLFHHARERLELHPSIGEPRAFGIGPHAAAIPILLQIFATGSPAQTMLAPVQDALESVRYYRLLDRIEEHDTNTPFLAETTYQAWRSKPLTERLQSDSIALRLLDMYLDDRPRFDELSQLLGPTGLGLVNHFLIHRIKVPTGSSESANDDSRAANYFLGFFPGDSLAGTGDLFSYAGLSAGTRRVIQLLTHLVYDRSSVQLLEQPEDSIHPGLLEKVLDILATYADQSQTIMSTHSSRVVNLLSAENIRLIMSQEGTTQCRPLSAQELDSAEQYLMDEGSLAEYLETL